MSSSEASDEFNIPIVHVVMPFAGGGKPKHVNACLTVETMAVLWISGRI